MAANFDTTQLNLSDIREPDFRDYCRKFPQKTPYYIFKPRGGKGWTTRYKKLSDIAILAHLQGLYCVGTRARWYPEYIIFDLDDVSPDKIEHIRETLKLDEKNSMLCTSESEGSYHYLGKPKYFDKPLHCLRLHEILQRLAKKLDVEIYPQPRHCVRLPFSPYQNPVDSDYQAVEGWSWQDKLYWFNKLDELDLSEIPEHQFELDFTPVTKQPSEQKIIQPITGSRGERVDVRGLIEHGLQARGTRHNVQFHILLKLYRENWTKNDAIKFTWDWIQKKNNGLSKDFVRCPQEVYKDIQRQASYVYTHTYLENYFPDGTHNLHTGWITKPDLKDIALITEGNIPRMNFLFNLLRYTYPRKLRDYVNVHRDKLVSWASNRTYIKFLNELENKNIIRRGYSYQPGRYSKYIKLNWTFREPEQAILIDGRTPDNFESTLKIAYQPSELREILKQAGSKDPTISKALKTLYDPGL